MRKHWEISLNKAAGLEISRDELIRLRKLAYQLSGPKTPVFAYYAIALVTLILAIAAIPYVMELGLDLGKVIK